MGSCGRAATARGAAVYVSVRSCVVAVRAARPFHGLRGLVFQFAPPSCAPAPLPA